MGHKIFVSYKYADDSIYPLPRHYYSTVRDYVDIFEADIDKTKYNIYKGESDGEDLSRLSQATIWAKLKDRIYDSSVTVVFISPNMKENKPEQLQWIPQEISYSLKEIQRKTQYGNPVTSRTNALVGVVLPDRNGHYDYFTEKYARSSNTFQIIKNNVLNLKSGAPASLVFYEPSYMVVANWGDFISKYDCIIESALSLQEYAEYYNIQKEVTR